MTDGTTPRRLREPRRETGSGLSAPAVIATVVAVMLVGLATALSPIAMRNDLPPRIVIATGPESGTYPALGVEVAEILESEGVTAPVELIPTIGARAAGPRLCSRHSGFAIPTTISSPGIAADGRRDDD
jgi:TRAP-type uncharacterized transport system substrate-binding protein